MNAETAHHPTAEQLSDFVLGRLAPPVAERVAAHIESCDSCCDALNEIPDDRIVQLAREAAQPMSAVDTGLTGLGDTNSGMRGSDAPIDIAARLADHPRYRIVDRLGAGGMGEVFKAEHRLMGRPVAIKVIRGDFMASPLAVSRFRTEVRASSPLWLPNVVTVHHDEQVADMHFLVMEFVEGVSLDRHVDEHGPLNVEQACHVIRRAALGLQHADEHGLVHRDIKPHNLILTPDNNVKILDFGLARFATTAATDEAPQESAGLTGANLALGTPDYIAPEQADNARSADIRADIYSLGCTIYFLLTGRPPFPDGSHLEKISSHLLLEPAPLAEDGRSIPADVVSVVRKMMAKSPEDRFQTPTELVAALDDLLPHREPVAVRRTRPRTQPSVRRGKRVPMQLIAGLLLAAGVIVSGFIAMHFWTQDNGGSSDIPGSGNDAGTAQFRAELLENLPRIDGVKIVFVMPQQTYYPDYIPVRRVLESQGAVVSTAALGLSIRPTEDDPGEPFQASMLLKDVNPREFDAVVFVGGVMDNLDDQGPANADIRRILAGMNDGRRVVAGICGGMMAISDAGYFKGHTIANFEMIQHEFATKHATRSMDCVVSSGNVITAAEPDFAEEFAATIVRKLAPDP